jgi:hypothetical protein
MEFKHGLGMRKVIKIIYKNFQLSSQLLSVEELLSKEISCIF